MALAFRGFEDRQRREHNERMSLAWHIEALRRAKKLPKLDRLLVKQGQRRRQTWQEQMHIMSMWAAAMRKVEAHKAGSK